MTDFWDDKVLMDTLSALPVYRGKATDAFKEANLATSTARHFAHCQDRKLNRKTLDKLARFARKRAEELRESVHILREIADTLEDRVKAQEWRDAA